jgi:hypothetical protein
MRPVLGVLLVVLAACDASDRDARVDGATSAGEQPVNTRPAPPLPDRADFVWADPASPPRDLREDTAACKRELAEDAWLARQEPFLQLMWYLGCFEKKGWAHKRFTVGAPGAEQAQRPKPAPSGVKR